MHMSCSCDCASALAAGETASAIVAGTVSGSHVLKIEGYSRTIGLGVGKPIDSGTFNVGGHGWCIGYYPDGWDSAHSDYISMALVLVNTDAAEVKASFRFSLLHHAKGKQVPLTTESAGVFKAKGNGLVLINFIKRKKLEESAYLKDDCFKARCDVTVTKEIRVTEAIATQFGVVPPSDMHRHFGRLLSGGEGADVTFNVGGETFAAHRCVLAARSSVFMAELFGPMMEKTAACVQIDDMDANAFKAMLHFIYTDSLPAMDEGAGESSAMSQHLLVAADRYNLERLKLICEHELCSYIDTNTVTTTLTLAEQHGCHGLKEACLDFLKSPGNLKAVMPTEGFEHLTSSCPSLLKEFDHAAIKLWDHLLPMWLSGKE